MASLSKHLSIASQVRRINKQLASVAQSCEADVAATLLTQTALTAAEIRQQAPEGETGNLKKSIRIEEVRNGTKFAVKIKVGDATTKKTVAAGKAGHGYTYDYSRAVEFGTANTPAHPFFFPIYRARKRDIRLAVKKAIRKAVREKFK